MRIISYIAMIATAAFCQLSSCMNQAPNSGDRNQSSPAARTLDMWSLKLPSDFRARSVRTQNRVVEVDFDNNEVRVPSSMENINISFAGSEVGSSTSLSFVRHRRDNVIQVPGGNQRAPSAPLAMRQPQFHSFMIPAGNPHASSARSVDMRQPQLPSLMIPAGNPHASSARSVDMRQPQLHSITIPAGNPHAFPEHRVETRPTIERKEENAQQKIGSERREIDSEDSKTLNKKTEESKPPKKPKPLETIEGPDSHIEEGKRKEAKKIDKIDREKFLNKYSNQALDDEATEQIKVLFDSGIKSPTAILDELLTPCNAKKKERAFWLVAKKVDHFIKSLKTGQKTAD